MYNPVSRSYGEPHKRPEVQNATIEFIAPSEYMVGLVFFLFLIGLSIKDAQISLYTFLCVRLYVFLQLRPPQPAVYLFVLDVSHNAVETGYLKEFCQSVLDNIHLYVEPYFVSFQLDLLFIKTFFF